MKKTAYSLLEMSIVTVIVGILISGVMAGAGMIRSSKLSNARLFTAKSVVPEINGLVAWYETSTKESLNAAETLDGKTITNWYDLTPGSNSNIYGATKKNQLASSSAGVTFVSNGINNTPSIKFSGSSNVNMAMSNSGPSTNFYQGTSTQNTVFVVFRPITAPSSTSQTLLDSGASGSPTASIGVKNTEVNLNAGSAANISATFSTGNDYIVVAYLNNTLSQAFVNNATTASGSGTTGSNQLTGLIIGTNKSGSSGFGGLISEIIIYNRPLKIQERKDVMDYLAKKYKISVTGL